MENGFPGQPNAFPRLPAAHPRQGNAGTILKTSDGGTTWTDLSISTTYVFWSVFFTNTNTGYIVGGQYLSGGVGIILKTTDGGLTWTALYYDTTLNSVFFTDSNTGYAVGGSGTIYNTVNGGSTWTAQTSGTRNRLKCVYFTTGNTGYAVGDGETILKTTNGGTFNDETVSPEQTYILYPNPANDIITSLDKKKLPGVTTISIYNITGTLVMQLEIGDRNLVELDISTLAKGIYLVKIQTRMIIECKKLVVN